MTARRRLIVLDIDDTLYLEREYVKSGFLAVAAWADSELGVRGFADRAWSEFMAGHRSDTFDRVLRSFHREPSRALVSKLVAIYLGHTPRISVLDDARRFLDGAIGRMDIAVVSDGPVQSQRAKSEALGLGRWASRIVLTEELGPDVPEAGSAGVRELAKHVSGQLSRLCLRGRQPVEGLRRTECFRVADGSRAPAAGAPRGDSRR